MHLNKVILLGRVGERGATLHTDARGMAVCAFTLEVDTPRPSGSVFTTYRPVEITRKRDRRRLVSQVDVYKLAMASHLVHALRNMSNSSEQVHMSNDEHAPDTSSTIHSPPRIHVSEVSDGTPRLPNHDTAWEER